MRQSLIAILFLPVLCFSHGESIEFNNVWEISGMEESIDVAQLIYISCAVSVPDSKTWEFNEEYHECVRDYVLSVFTSFCQEKTRIKGGGIVYAGFDKKAYLQFLEGKEEQCIQAMRRATSKEVFFSVINELIGSGEKKSESLQIDTQDSHYDFNEINLNVETCSLLPDLEQESS